ncbi:hypothetical protein [Paeniglutamicibacter terrestris]|uniref:Phage portal protein n=1 Tax=Paeniglutamicibacter terrestris TaxID=2723403 RepID=A0ABX1G562_9MICC|nr:hypothetical protein [Paeniglutamicibacter terrestris]NKG21099.1 hypothetical protein [Paeniglutamicibacter terrestris]
MIRKLTDAERVIFNRLYGRIGQKKQRNRLKHDYIAMQAKFQRISYSIPEEMYRLAVPLGWAHKAVYVPSSRINPEDFTIPGGSTLLDDLDGVYFESHVRELEMLATESALGQSCSFIFVTPGETAKGEPRVIVAVRDATEATADIDSRTGRVVSALELVEPKKSLLYLNTGLTLDIQQAPSGDWVVVEEYKAVVGRVMCTPYVWGRTLQRPLGSSRVSRTVMGLIDRMVLGMLRQDVASDFYAAPLVALMDADESMFLDSRGNRINPLKAMMGSLLGIPGYRDEETGDMRVPKMQQLTQASFQPFTESNRDIAAAFHAATDIPMGQLGVVQDNPSSAEAIRASEHGLVSLVQHQLLFFERMRLDLARNILSVFHGGETPAMLADIRKMRANFGDPANTTSSQLADSGQKFVTAHPELAGSRLAWRRSGLTEKEMTEAEAHVAKTQSRSLIELALESKRARAADVPPGTSNAAVESPATE